MKCFSVHKGIRSRGELWQYRRGDCRAFFLSLRIFTAAFFYEMALRGPEKWPPAGGLLRKGDY